jgi:hypothetical protein
VEQAESATRPQRTPTAALVLVGIALLFAHGGTWSFGRSFLVMESCARMTDRPDFLMPLHRDGNSLAWLVAHDRWWTAALVLSSAPALWFWWWRRSRMAYGRLLGIALCVAGSGAAVYAMLERPRVFHPWFAGASTWIAGSDAVRVGGTWWVLLVAHAVFVAAFLAAPAPGDPDAMSDVQLRRLLRRHRGGVATQGPTSVLPSSSAALPRLRRARAARPPR